MNTLIILSAISGYLWCTYGLLKHKDPFAISSFLLWLIMDIIMVRNTLKAGTDLRLIGTYTICTFVFFILLLFKQKFEWDKKRDTPIATVAILLLIISCLSRPNIGVYAGAIALFIAGIPNMIKMLGLINPPMRITYTALCFSLGSLFTVLSAYEEKSTLEEYVYPVLSLIYWNIILVVLATKQIKTLRM